MCLCTSSLFAQKFKALDYSDFDKSDLKTNLFIENKSPLSAIGGDYDTYNMYSFLQMYKELAINDKINQFKNFNELKRIAQPINYSNIVKIGLMHFEYEYLDKKSFSNKNIEVVGNKVTKKSSGYIFNKKTSTVIAPISFVKRGLKTTYLLENDFFINNTSNQIISIQANFDDGQGYKKITFNTPLTIEYLQKGDKKLAFKIELSNGEIIERKSSIKIDYSNEDLASIYKMAPSEVTSSLTADLSAYSGATSHQGLAEYEIFLGADNILDKPIFIVDGFDPSDTRILSGIYDLLGYDNGGTPENLADYIRNEEDYDVVLINFPTYFRLSGGTLQSLANSTDVNTDGVIDVLDYPSSVIVDGGADFIERNALSVVEIINIINTQKVGTEENVVIGPSMGGLITRYALNYMETQGMNHETRLWMSFDSPHLGANVPIGFQHLFNYLAYGLDTWVGDFSMEALRPIVDGMLKSAAARQMLNDHYEPHISSGTDFNSSLTLPIKHPFSTTFYSAINAMTLSGFPETTRNVSLINGSGIGNPYQHKNGNNVMPGDKVLDAFLPDVATLTDAYFDVWFTPSAGQTAVIDDIWVDAPWICFCDINSDADSQAYSYSDGIDAAPGGLFDLGALADGFGSDPTINAFFGALTTDYFNFIPAVSSMALNTNPNIDWYQDIDLGNGDTPWDGTTTTNPETPFVNWYMPDNNEAHVTLTQQNVAFSLDEILKKADISPKVVLQGAAINPNTGEESLMRDDLRVDGLIPTISPYTDALTCDSSVFNVTGNDAIVDWVFIELRDAADNTSLIASQSALLQRDGDVVNLDGVSSVDFEIPGTTYYVVIKHRNHLGIMSSTPIALSRITTALDFTNATNPITNGTNAQTTFGMPANILGMWAGDVNNDGLIRYLGPSNDGVSIKTTVLDYSGNTTQSNFYPFTSYNNADINLNGQVRYLGPGNDTNMLKTILQSHPGNTTLSNFFPFTQQLPEGTN